MGKDIILPKDVLIQSKETENVSGAINATIGMAMLNKKNNEYSYIKRNSKKFIMR